MGRIRILKQIRNHWETKKLNELNEQHELHSERIKRLRHDYAIATDPAIRFRQGCFILAIGTFY